MKTDSELQNDVMKELQWEPSVDAAEIGVGVKDGTVTLSGNVDSLGEKWNAERVAARVFGVKAVASEIKVRLPGSFERPDEDIGRAAANVLEWNTLVPHERIKVRVQDGEITLSGEVDWRFQKNAAEDAVRNLMGVRAVRNDITVNPLEEPVDIRDRIEDALERNALCDAQAITVKIEGGHLILSGSVHSWAERWEAENAAWAAPGVTEVGNNIVVNP
jgi:osmotically-inducible protein OsmY